MVDVQGDVLRPPHSTTPAAVKSNKNQKWVKLFNLVFDRGLISEAWSIGKIILVYKQKGETSDPSNYRPIRLLSCMGNLKVFTAVINIFSLLKKARSRLLIWYPERAVKQNN